MNFNQVTYFLAIIEQKNFSHAANEVFISQSSLSKQIKSLEIELGVILFSRESHKIELTEAGEAFLHFAKQFQKEYLNMMSTLSLYKIKDKITYSIKMGTIPILCCHDIIQRINLESINENINIDLLEREQSELVKMLDRNQIDFAVLRTDYLFPDEYDFIQLVTEKIGIVCSIKHPLATKEKLRLQDLKNESFLLLNNTSSLYNLAVDACKNAGFSPKVNYVTSRHELLLAMVNDKLCLTMLPMSLLDLENRQSLKFIPLEDTIISNIAIVRRKDLKNNKKVQFFESALKEYLQDHDLFNIE